MDQQPITSAVPTHEIEWTPALAKVVGEAEYRQFCDEEPAWQDDRYVVAEPEQASNPWTTLTEDDREAAEDHLTEVFFDEAVAPNYDLMVRLFDISTRGKCYEAHDMFLQICASWGDKAYFSDDALADYLSTRERDASGLVPGYDAIATMFSKARVLLTRE